MKNLKRENITSIEFDLENGFVWAIDKNDNSIFQACLMLRKDGEGYEKVINSRNCGHDEGLFGDFNNSLGYDSLDDSLNEFLKDCRIFGIKVT